jgi:hypothetical protein
MVKETNPAVWAEAETTAAPHAADHGFRAIGACRAGCTCISGRARP